MAPELLRGDPPSPASDVYAFGMLLWELFSRRSAYEELSPAEWDAALLEIADESCDPPRRPTPPADCPPFFQNLMSR